jgi:serine/threonine protein kinase
MPDLVGQRVGQYVITGLLGQGGMATVYRAYQESVKRDVAVKVIEARLASVTDFVRRFEREAQTIALLSHPHILKMFDYGQHEDLVYLVMELIAGGNLATLIHQGALPLETVSRILDQMASALDYAHQRGIIHRDLKPQNVLLDENGNALLTDFGIAKILGETTVLTHTGMAMGTPAYMAPEQWRGESVDARTDIYALGIILFEMLTGRLPYQAETPYSMMHMHVYESLPPICTIRPELPVGVERVLNKAIAKKREQRFDSAAQVSAAFNSAIAGDALSELEIPATPEPAETIVEVTPPPVPAPEHVITATPVHGAPPTLPRRSRRNFLVGIGLGVLGGLALLALIAGLILILSNLQGVQVAGEATSSPTDTATPPPPASPSATILVEGATASPSATSSPTAVPTDTPTETPTPKPNLETRAAETLAQRATLTAIFVASFSATPMPSETPTPNEQETLDAMVAGTVTALALTSAALMPTPTPIPTETPTWTPTELPTVTPLPPVENGSCSSGLPSRLVVGQQARVSPGGTPNRVRDVPGGTYLGQIPVEGVFTVLEGPVCASGITWWRVNYNGLVGWTAESEGSEYYLEPFTEPTSTPPPPTVSGQIAFTLNSGRGWQIYVINPDGGGMRAITSRGDNGIYGIAWSPGHDRLAFESNRDGNEEIYTANADGSNLRRLTSSSGVDRAPTWSPDGSQIAFDSDRGGNFEIYVMNTDGSSQHNLTNSSADDSSPAWQPVPGAAAGQ